jgi:hypothetical protein
MDRFPGAHGTGCLKSWCGGGRKSLAPLLFTPWLATNQPPISPKMSHAMRHILPLTTKTLLDAHRSGSRSRSLRLVKAAIAKALGIGRARYTECWRPLVDGYYGRYIVHAVVGRTQAYVSGGCRLLRGDDIGSRGRRGSIFVFISTGEVFLSLLAGMSILAVTKTTNSTSTAVYTALGPNRFRDFWRE